MKHPMQHVFWTVLWLGLVKVETSCVSLSGIEQGGGEGLIDLDTIRVSLASEPFNLSNPIIPTVAGCSVGLETPVSMRNLLGIDTAAFSISNMFRPNGVALDIFGDRETSDARRRCQPTTDEETELFDLHLRVAIMYALTYGGLKDMPYCRVYLEPLMEARGHPLSLLEGELNTDTPWGLAKAYVDEIFEFLNENDGWNADGSLSQEYNGIPFSDYAKTDSEGNSWSPYIPKNSPRKFNRKRRWQPLIESNDLGYVAVQEHVTPHIGTTARLFGFRSKKDEKRFASRELSRPSYRKKYDEVVHDIIEESRLMATDEYKQAAITFFDNKFLSLVPLKISFFMRIAATTGSVLKAVQARLESPLASLVLCDRRDMDTERALEFYKLTVEVQLAMYNGVIMAWKEKIRHDLPRPTSIVRSELGDTLVEAYAGPGVGLQTLKASEWKPFVRTMPHSEFPSASACLCQVFAEQVAYSLGEDTIDPPLEFDVGGVMLEFDSWSEISSVCGESRVWGGMHFADSVPAGAEICGGNLIAQPIAGSIGDLIDGDESAAIFNRDGGELLVRPL